MAQFDDVNNIFKQLQDTFINARLEYDSYIKENISRAADYAEALAFNEDMDDPLVKAAIKYDNTVKELSKKKENAFNALHKHVSNLENQGMDVFSLGWIQPDQSSSSDRYDWYQYRDYLNDRRSKFNYYTEKELTDPKNKKRYEERIESDRRRKENARNNRRWERQANVHNNIETEQTSDIRARLDDLRNKRDIAKRQEAELKEILGKDYYNNQEWVDVFNSYMAYEKEYEELRKAYNTGRSTNTNKRLELPAPKEGAPMFEGGAVPSVIADSTDFSDYQIYNKNNFEKKLNQKRRTTTSPLRGSANFFYDSEVVDSPWKRISSEPEAPIGPQRGDQFYDSKRKRQYVYEGPDDVFEGQHRFISDQGRTFVGNIDDFEKFTDESRFLDIDEMIGYRDAIDTMSYYNSKTSSPEAYNDPEGFWKNAEDSINNVDRYERNVKKKIKNHRMDKDSYTNKKLLKNRLNEWKKKNTTNNTNTTKELEKEIETNNTQSYYNASNEPDISDLSPETLANLTDAEIEEWAQSADDYQRAMDLRTQAREQIGWKPLEQQIEQQAESQQEQRREQADTNKETTQTQTETFNEANQEQQTRQQETKPIETNETKKTKPDVDSSRSARIKKAKSKKISNGKGKYRVKAEGKNFKSIVANTMVNAVVDETEKMFKESAQEIFDEVFESGRYDVKGELEEWGRDWHRTNFRHPDKMTDAELANLTDEEFEQLKTMANGNKDKIDKWEKRRGKGKAEQAYEDYRNGNYYYDNSENTNPYRYDIPEYDFEVDEDGNVKKINKTGETKKVIIEENKSSKRKTMPDDLPNSRVARGGDDIFSWMKKHKVSIADVGFNLFGAIGDYKNSRRQGHGVVSSFGRAAVSFAVGEVMGFWGSMAFGAVKGGAKLAVKGVELLYKENRKMNSAANNQAFGNAEFYDTQQLATMRQSGMEMAKMAQYNLQQTLMGTEATYLHR